MLVRSRGLWVPGHQQRMCGAHALTPHPAEVPTLFLHFMDVRGTSMAGKCAGLRELIRSIAARMSSFSISYLRGSNHDCSVNGSEGPQGVPGRARSCEGATLENPSTGKLPPIWKSVIAETV